MLITGHGAHCPAFAAPHQVTRGPPACGKHQPVQDVACPSQASWEIAAPADPGPNHAKSVSSRSVSHCQSNRETGSRGWRWNIPEILETLRQRSIHRTVDATPDTQDSTMNSNGHDRFCSQERMMVNTKLKMISRRATTGEHTMQYTGGILLNCALETCIVLLTNVTLKKFLNVNKNRRM